MPISESGGPYSSLGGHRLRFVVEVARLRQHSLNASDGDKRIVLELDVDELGPSLGSSAVSVGGVRGRCAACGAASPRSRAPTASRAMALRATLDLRTSAVPPGRVAGRPGPALHDAQRPRTPRLTWPHQGIGPFAQVTAPAAG